MTALDAARAALRARQGRGARHDAPEAPARDLALARRGTAYFARLLNALADADLHLPSRRPGQSRAHLIAEIALEARAISRQVEAVTAGQAPPPLWPDATARAAEIDLAATLPARALRHLFDHAAIHLDVVWRDLPGQGWACDTPAGPLRATPRTRAAQLWLGALDLGNGGQLRDLPTDLIPLKGPTMSTLFPSPAWPTIPVAGETAAYPVHRIFCVGRNYAAHAAEMGVEVDREAPFYFTKSALTAQPSDSVIAYPPGTENFHYEMELVLVLGAAVFRADLATAKAAIYAYGCGLDMTRRDLQLAARAKQRPWDLGKDVEQSAVFAPLTKAAAFGAIGDQRIHLEVNGEQRQDALLSDLIWKVEELVSHLSHYYHLQPGDVIMTGTPAGVGAVVTGDVITGGIEGLAPIRLTVAAAE